MDLVRSEEQRLFAETAREFCEREIAPLVAAGERDERFPPGLFLQLGEAGYLGLGYPEELGGSGGDVVLQTIWIEELSRINSGIAAAVMVQQGLATSMLVKQGSAEQLERYVRPALRGEKVGSFCLTEPGSGSEALGMLSTATRSGDGWELNGTKMFITNAPMSDYFLFICYTDRSQGSKGVSVFVVDRESPGLSVRRLEKVGNRTAETGEVVFEAVQVPDSARLGNLGEGYRYIMAGLEHGRVVHGARSLGVARASYEAAHAYALQRVQFGKPIAKHQAIAFKLARMAVAIENARLQLHQAATLVAAGQKAMKEASMAKLVCSEAAELASTEAMQIHGGYGYMMEYPVQRYWRDARLCPITEGTTEIQLMIIARELGL